MEIRGVLDRFALLVVLAACGADAQQVSNDLVTSSDPELVELASALLPDLAEHSGLELRAPVRLETRSREQLVDYLKVKLDEELPPDEAKARVDAYSLLGLVPVDLDLRAVLMSLYTEQVAGFYEPDSTALFVMDDQPKEVLEGLLVHELMHAIQDQHTDLGSLTDRKFGNDRIIAAQAAIEGQATLVMLEFMAKQTTGVAVDLGQVSDFASQMRPLLEETRSQFPVLASSPRVIRESLLFPYLEGVNFVQSLWLQAGRVAPFGERLPISTEQVLLKSTAEEPIKVEVEVRGAQVVKEDVLGQLVVGIMVEEHLGAETGPLTEGWEGDLYVLIENARNKRGLVWFALWKDTASRDRFANAMQPALEDLPELAELARLEVAGWPATELRVGSVDGVTITPRVVSNP